MTASVRQCQRQCQCDSVSVSVQNPVPEKETEPECSGAGAAEDHEGVAGQLVQEVNQVDLFVLEHTETGQIFYTRGRLIFNRSQEDLTEVKSYKVRRLP